MVCYIALNDYAYLLMIISLYGPQLSLLTWSFGVLQNQVALKRKKCRKPIDVPKNEEPPEKTDLAFPTTQKMNQPTTQKMNEPISVRIEDVAT